MRLSGNINTEAKPFLPVKPSKHSRIAKKNFPDRQKFSLI